MDRFLRLRCLLACLLLSSLLLYLPMAFSQDQELEEAAEFQRVEEFFATYCYDCHSGSGAEGGVRADIFQPPVAWGDHLENIERIVLVLKEQQMPPADMDQPSVTDRVQMIEWIEGQLRDFEIGGPVRPGRVTIRRLNRAEYNNTIRDLVGLDLKLADDFPSDDVGSGFDNIGDVLALPPLLMEKYLNSAQRIANQVVSQPERLAEIFPDQPQDAENLQEVAEVAVRNATRFASRAFRRPLTEDESARLLELMTAAWQAEASKEEILQTVITAVLTSPHFIYRIEDDPAAEFVDGVRPLNDYELASRLSYFLWSSMPDQQLFDLAASGQLREPEQLAAQVPRMLADPKSHALIDNFVGQWLQLRDLENISPDPDLFADFDEDLRLAMRRETELLFARIMAENRSVLDLLNADYTFVNRRLAEHYGLQDSWEQGQAVDWLSTNKRDSGSGNGEHSIHAAGNSATVKDEVSNINEVNELHEDPFRMVSWSGQRRGVLMHAGILMLTSNPTRTSPVKRGKWILDNLLAEPPPPAPPDVPELEEPDGPAVGTLRERMEQHRADPNCAICHTKMDALGFGLENFDVIGAWRELDGTAAIDPSGELPGGRTFQTPVDLVGILVEEKKNEFTRCLVTKLLTYSIGRGLGVSDRASVRQIVEQTIADDYRFVTLVQAIVTSPPFMMQESG